MITSSSRSAVTRFCENSQSRRIKKQTGALAWYEKKPPMSKIREAPVDIFKIKHIMQKAGLDESQVRIKIAGRNINNLRYADDTTLMEESEEELKSLLMQVKEESAKVGLKLSIKKTKFMASTLITSWQIDGEEMEVVTDFIFLGSKITTDGDCSQEIKRRLLLVGGGYGKSRQHTKK
ncbi:putative uncharacterized transposon-derived protein F52C9.6 [Varanus komodoensis]|nr:putative uncharacterized transposon-derived protein F52C9.6 [Varanus komodoensis]